LGNLDEKTEKKYCHKDADGRLYTLGDLNNPNPDRPNLTYEFLGHRKVWRWTKDRMEAAYKAGIVVQPSPGAVPRVKRYLDEQEGWPLDDVWEDIPPLNSQAKERLGYPTRKPVALLERIIQASSNPGDVVLDPFCGCGTTIDAAEKLGLKWIGVDRCRTNSIAVRAGGLGQCLYRITQCLCVGLAVFTRIRHGCQTVGIDAAAFAACVSAHLFGMAQES
jgi:adenine specific DNA methylase Mod